MSKLSDLKAKAAAVSANIHQDITAYVSALEDKVAANKLYAYAAAAVVLFIVIAVAWHKMK